MTRFDRKAQSQPKHKSAPASGASKAPRPPPVQRPGWTGPSYLHKKARPKATASTAAAGDAGPRPQPQPQVLPLELQQLVLDVFRDTFPASRDFDALKPTLHVINSALSDGDFEAAFPTEDHREAYAVRWGPSRALCYANLLAGLISSDIADEPWTTNFLGRGGGAPFPRRAVCLGGGAAEVMAFGALLRHVKSHATGEHPPARAEAAADPHSLVPAAEDGEQAGLGTCPLQLALVDTTDWSSAIAKLGRGLTTAPVLSKYASEMARAKNAPLVDPGSMRVTFGRESIPTAGVDALKAVIGPDAALITMLFTLNDLYAASVSRTAKLLIEVTVAAPTGSLLLVVDRPGGYPETGIPRDANEETAKKIPMAWLVDRMLLGKQSKADEEGRSTPSEPGWEKLVGDECRWHRLEEGLEFPVSMENTRFQMHLFRRL